MKKNIISIAALLTGAVLMTGCSSENLEVNPESDVTTVTSEGKTEETTEAIKEMYRQVGTPKFNEDGIIQRGIIIRHLVLSNHIQNSKNILKWIKENMPQDVYVSIMAQYFPTYKAKEDELLNRKLTKKEYKEIEKFLYTLDLKNGYIQELGEHEEEYVPDF